MTQLATAPASATVSREPEGGDLVAAGSERRRRWRRSSCRRSAAFNAEGVTIRVAVSVIRSEQYEAPSCAPRSRRFARTWRSERASRPEPC
jgi:hypothetical protein